MIKNVGFASYADDSTPYTIGDEIDQVLSSSEDTLVSLLEQFKENQMKANADKCLLLLNQHSELSEKV